MSRRTGARAKAWCLLIHAKASLSLSYEPTNIIHLTLAGGGGGVAGVGGASGRRDRRGRAVQVDPMKPTRKAPGTKRLKLKYGKLLSSFAFKFNLRRYNVAAARRRRRLLAGDVSAGPVGRTLFPLREANPI